MTGNVKHPRVSASEESIAVVMNSAAANVSIKSFQHKKSPEVSFGRFHHLSIFVAVYFLIPLNNGHDAACRLFNGFI